MSVVAIVVLALVVAAAGVLVGSVQRARVEQRVAARLPVGASGMIAGSEPLALGGALATIVAADDTKLASLVLLAPYLNAPRWLRVLSYASPAIAMVLPYVGGDPLRSIHDPEARAKALAYGATTPGLVRELIRAADDARAVLA